jgi:hypothetical protein
MDKDEARAVVQKALQGEMSVRDFADWVYGTPELESLLGSDLYLELLSFNYAQVDVLPDNFILETLLWNVNDQLSPQPKGSALTDQDIQSRKYLAKALRVARTVLAGELSVLESARQLAQLLARGGLEHSDPDFVTFYAIESETEELPIGAVRRLWAEEALADKDKEIARAEALYRDIALQSCRNLIARFGPTVGMQLTD